MASTQQLFARWLGIILLLVGIIGFFTQEMLLMFGINTFHNLVHLVTGALGILAAMSSGAAKTFNTLFGIVYLIVAILGFLNIEAIVSLLNLNMADNLLHLVIGIVALWVGFKASSAH